MFYSPPDLRSARFRCILYLYHILFAAKEEDEPMPTDYRTVRLMKNRLYPTYRLHAVMAAKRVRISSVSSTVRQ